jgi:E3 ubiquitin-protein ligase BIG BROTHER-like protein
MWSEGKTKSNDCHICIQEFVRGKKFKALKCSHEYHAECIDEWLKIEKRCPVCNASPI